MSEVSWGLKDRDSSIAWHTCSGVRPVLALETHRFQRQFVATMELSLAQAVNARQVRLLVHRVAPLDGAVFAELVERAKAAA